MSDTPAIRFTEFTETLEQRKLEDFLTVSTEKNTENAYNKNDVLSVSGDFGIVNQIEFQGRSFAGASVSNYGVVHTGDVVYTKSPLNSNPYGIIKTNKGKTGIVSTLYAVYHTKDNAFPDFVQVYFEQHARMNNYMHPLVNKGAKNDMKVSAENALKGPVYFPSYEEQKTISAYFASLDNLITIHQEKYDTLVNVKKSMYRKLFPQSEAELPEVRFNNGGKWVKYKLGDIITPYSDPVETPHDGYTRLGIRSFGKGTFHNDVPAGQELETAQMHRVAAHMFIVNITFGWEHAVAITTEDDAGKLVSHRFPQFAMTDKVDDRFLKYVVLDERFHHHLLLASPGGAGRNRVLSIPQMLEYELYIPQDVEEQKRIAGMLDSLNKLTDLYAEKIQKLKQIKAACLEGMFI